MDWSIPKKYGRLLIKGKKKTNKKTPDFMSIKVTTRNTRRKGDKIIWNLLRRGIYLK